MSRPEFERLGRSGGQNVIRLKDGPRIYLSDGDLAAFEETGNLPENTAKTPIRPLTPEERLTVVEKELARAHARLDAIDAAAEKPAKKGKEKTDEA